MIAAYAAIVLLGLFASYRFGRWMEARAREAERLVVDVAAIKHRTRKVTGEDRHTKARQERLRQTLPRPPETTLDPFGPRRKS